MNASRLLLSWTAVTLLALAGCGQSGSGTSANHDHDHDHDHDHGHAHAEDGDGADHAHPSGDGDDQDHDHDHDVHGGGDHGHDEVSIGTTMLGEHEVACAQGHGSVEPGKEMHLVVKLPYDDGGASVIRAWIGTEDRLSSMVGKGEYATSHGDYDLHVEAPDPLPDGAMWWIELEKPDGTLLTGAVGYR